MGIKLQGPSAENRNRSREAYGVRVACSRYRPPSARESSSKLPALHTLRATSYFRKFHRGAANIINVCSTEKKSALTSREFVVLREIVFPYTLASRRIICAS